MSSVGKASVVDQHLLFIVNYTWERNLTIVTNVEGLSFMLHIFRNIRESTLGRNRSNVIYVVRTSAADQHLTVIVWSTPERNHTPARRAGRASAGGPTFMLISESTRERSPTNVRRVTRASVRP